ncbi:MAG: preprotein translocase subunit SecE [Oscillospiraceae bacterium]|nr:preprotein translocase subunit SecE [Oscillospiraceae bacterium]
MAEDLELDKNSPEGEDEGKPAKKAKTDDRKGSKKANKKNKKGIVKFFKDAKAEFKKVVWPGPKETTRNTIVVLIVCVLAGALVFGVDSLFGLLNNLLFR